MTELRFCQSDLDGQIISSGTPAHGNGWDRSSSRIAAPLRGMPVGVFEMNTKRMSITLAADDLCLTQSAVSRQVRALEAMLGVKLFGARPSLHRLHDGRGAIEASLS